MQLRTRPYVQNLPHVYIFLLIQLMKHFKLYVESSSILNIWLHLVYRLYIMVYLDCVHICILVSLVMQMMICWWQGRHQFWFCVCLTVRMSYLRALLLCTSISSEWNAHVYMGQLLELLLDLMLVLNVKIQDYWVQSGTNANIYK